jgi:hypothetical protein
MKLFNVSKWRGPPGDRYLQEVYCVSADTKGEVDAAFPSGGGWLVTRVSVLTLGEAVLDARSRFPEPPKSDKKEQPEGGE